MKKILLAAFAVASLALQAQRSYDTIVDRGIYRSYVSTTLRLPVAVTYTLSNGGGKASRKDDNFINETSIPVLTGKDYAGSGYDKGHLAPCEDFSMNDSLQDLTFRYYNCVPQAPGLNRGKWRTLESKTLKMSKLTKICVVNYMSYSGKNAKGIYVPTVCYKAVYDMATRKLLWANGYENTFDCKDVAVSPEVLMICDLLYKLETKQ